MNNDQDRICLKDKHKSLNISKYNFFLSLIKFCFMNKSILIGVQGYSNPFTKKERKINDREKVNSSTKNSNKPF